MRTAATLRISLLIASTSVFALVGGPAALALTPTPAPTPTLTEPTVPEPVATYFASGLVPRLADLYGPGKKAGSGIDFGQTAKVGDIHRVFAWTAEFLAGKSLAGKNSGNPTELTNNWVAPVAVKDREVGLATVWINPTRDNPELANFDLGPGLVTALAAAPKGDVLVRDDIHSAWFATDGTALVPLVSGTSGIATTTTIEAYRKSLPSVVPAPVTGVGANQGLLIAGIALLVVIALLAVFVLLPDRRRRARNADAALPEAVQEPVEVVPEPVAKALVIRTRSAQGVVSAPPTAAAPAAPSAAAAPPAAAARKPRAPRKPPAPKPTNPPE
ncbi:MAG: hypothetical protein JWO10_2083 [Microbacteriaceae bacterium]|nr:hypothetical protein [Microbacteriaceae bacterium]